MSKSRASHRRRRLRARPLLVAAGAVLAIAGSGCDDQPFCATHGICATTDMNISNYDMGLAPHPDLAVPPDLTPRGD